MCLGESKTTDLDYLLISQMKMHLFWKFFNVNMVVTYVVTWHTEEWLTKSQMFWLFVIIQMSWYDMHQIINWCDNL